MSDLRERRFHFTSLSSNSSSSRRLRMSDSTEVDEYDDFDVNYDYTKPRLFPSERKAINRPLYYSLEDDVEPSTSQEAEQITIEAPNLTNDVGKMDDLEREIQNIFIHVHDEEGRYYTDLTTFHGMRRIFVAQTWPSRLFWCAVVVNCLTFFMLYSGRTINAYHQKPSFMMRTARSSISPFNDLKFKFCKQNIRLNCSQLDLNTKYKCEELDECVLLFDLLLGHDHPLRHVKKRIRINHLTTGYAKLPIELSLFYGTRLKSRIFLSYFRQNRLSMRMRKRKLLTADEGGMCSEDWSLLDFPVEFLPKVSYTLGNCEHLRYSLYYYAQKGCIPHESRHVFGGNFTECLFAIQPTPKDIKEIQGFRCRPQCERVDLKVKLEKPFSKKVKVTSIYAILDLEMDTLIEERVVTKKMGMFDVMSLIGGATSLFLGCSCITLMEMFIYLFKSTTSMNKGLFENPSINIARRRAFQSPLVEEEIQSKSNTLYRKKISIVPLSPVRRLSTFSFNKYSRHSMRKEDRSDSLSSVQTLPNPKRSSRLEEASTSREWTTDSSFEKRRAPSLRHLKENVTFNNHSSHSIEKVVRKLPVEKRMSLDTNDEGKYLCRQTAVDIPDEDLAEYFADNGLEYPKDKSSVGETRMSKLHAMPSESGSTRSSISHRSIRSTRTSSEVAVITLVHEPAGTRKRPSKIYTRKMPMGDL
ncbi:unnamed protein product, partial [Mesorhabditis belari]|uniref:Uncharacterized protein n=1 Tax=Mesorhabditis belari TaxID=2138241 RepID=A0AAF3EYI6_9BILA